MTKNVLVTGCAGFIGYNLSKTLINQENNIIGIDSLNSAYDKKFKELRLQNLEERKFRPLLVQEYSSEPTRFSEHFLLSPQLTY